MERNTAMDALNKKPKILMLLTELGYGGAETSFIRLANYLSQSMDVTVVLFKGEYTSSGYSKGHEKLNADVVLLDENIQKNRLARWWQRIVRLRKLKRDYDACISFLSGPNILNVLAGYNTKTIVSLRGPRLHDANTPNWNRRIFQYLLDPITLNLAARIVPVSSGLKNEVAQLGGRWTIKKTVVISPFVITEKHLARAKELPPEQFLSLKNQPVIVAAGRLSVEKNFHYLIPIFAKLAQLQAGVKLLLVGDGPMVDALRKQCIALGLTINNMSEGVSSIIFAGYQKNPLALIGLGKIFAFPSGTEGVPNIVLEALATGVPVVAADAAWGARTVLLGEDCYGKEPYPTQQASASEYGILMPRIDDARYADEWVKILHECLQTDRWQKIFLEKGRQRLRDYDMQKVAPKWVELIESMRYYSDSDSPIPLLIRRVVNRVARPFGINPFPRAFHYDVAGKFEEIYQDNFWGSEQSRSGVGSELAFTLQYREALAELINTRKFTSIFDAPCGDLNWMPELLKQTNLHYQGGDVSSSLVIELQKRHPDLAIQQFDICRDVFPKVDVWHSRDCLFHLPFADIRKVLENFVASEIPYALLTTHKSFLLHENLDVRGIGFRFLDLERPPISLPKPLVYLPDYERGNDFPRYVGLWSREMIEAALR